MSKKHLSNKQLKEQIEAIKKANLFKGNTKEEVARSQVGIAFDYDGTLDDHFFGQENPEKEKVQEFLVEMLDKGFQVYIITRRYGPNSGHEEDEHTKVLMMAEKLGLPEENVFFTDREYKADLIHELGVHLLIDDDPVECSKVRECFSIYNAVCMDAEHNAPSKPSWRYGAEAMLRFYLKIFIDK